MIFISCYATSVKHITPSNWLAKVHNMLASCAGASLVEVYTALAYEGPALVPRLKQELAACLAEDGFTSVQQAVGADHR